MAAGPIFLPDAELSLKALPFLVIGGPIWKTADLRLRLRLFRE